MAAEIISSILDGPKGVYLVVDATDMKAAFQEFLRITREAEDEQRAYDDELATVTREEALQNFQPFIQYPSPLGEGRLPCARKDRQDTALQDVGYKRRVESEIR